MRWKIYYDGGSTFSDENGTPDQAPAFGVLAVVCEPDLWGCGDVVGLIDYLAQPGMSKCIRFGRLVANEVYERVLYTARHDTDFDLNVRHVYERGDYYWWNGGDSWQLPQGSV
jgi:hypothetical protein